LNLMSRRRRPRHLTSRSSWRPARFQRTERCGGRRGCVACKVACLLSSRSVITAAYQRYYGPNVVLEAIDRRAEAAAVNAIASGWRTAPWWRSAAGWPDSLSVSAPTSSATHLIDARPDFSLTAFSGHAGAFLFQRPRIKPRLGFVQAFKLNHNDAGFGCVTYVPPRQTESFGYVRGDCANRRVRQTSTFTLG
jgi:hypothetical protein